VVEVEVSGSRMQFFLFQIVCRWVY